MIYVGASPLPYWRTEVMMNERVFALLHDLSDAQVIVMEDLDYLTQEQKQELYYSLMVVKHRAIELSRNQVSR